MMKLLNTLVFDGHKYELNDTRGFMFPGRDYNLPSGFYGGRVDKLAKTDHKGIYMCMEGMKPIDLIILNPKELNKAELEEIAKIKKLELPAKATKDKILSLLNW